MTSTKRCTKCGETKPLDQFHLRSKQCPDGPRRSHCKACTAVADRRRYLRGLSVETQIIRKAMDPSFELSPEAKAVVYKPLDPELVAAWKKRQQNKRRAERRREREAEKRGQSMRGSRKFETVTL